MNNVYYRQDYWGQNRNAAFEQTVREGVDPDIFLSGTDEWRVQGGMYQIRK
jgi:hypothetical protein